MPVVVLFGHCMVAGWRRVGAAGVSGIQIVPIRSFRARTVTGRTGHAAARASFITATDRHGTGRNKNLPVWWTSRTIRRDVLIFMDNSAALKQEIKRLMVENLMLQVSPKILPIPSHYSVRGASVWIPWTPSNWSSPWTKRYGLKSPIPTGPNVFCIVLDTMATAVAAHKNSAKVHRQIVSAARTS